ncbi:lysosome-associated membrane glycoprotein 1a [Trichomycterus rosablanca]|uniref:lysosome-associated membrane glycoprotein 1a n=1 Tax=Trichomycterus rosablanca TaxID=2290929 RepID=UPI002F35D2CB
MTHKLQPGITTACFLLIGLLTVAHAVTLEVKNGNNTCIKAELSANFTIKYNTSTNGTATVQVTLPDSAVVGNESSCVGSGDSQKLQASFGAGHSLSLVFAKDGKLYRVSNLSLSYNLSDNNTFPNASGSGVVTQNTNTSGILAQLNTTYRCNSNSPFSLGGSGVTVILSKVHMEAYMTSANMSTNESICSADLPVTTTVATTTVAPTTLPPSPTPPSKPDTGTYNITTGNATCLLAKMGLQLNVTYDSKSQNKTVQGIVNMQPNKTSYSGSCENDTAILLLKEELTNLSFTFKLNATTKKYHLSAVNVSARWPDMKAPFSTSNSSLMEMPGTLGHSYMCSPEQTVSVVDTFSLNTFQVQVQPFGVQNNKFGSAEECPMQKDNMLVPIIVGACLAGLVLIVLVAYLIGRKRSRAGYQTI